MLSPENICLSEQPRLTRAQVVGCCSQGMLLMQRQHPCVSDSPRRCQSLSSNRLYWQLHRSSQFVKWISWGITSTMNAPSVIFLGQCKEDSMLPPGCCFLSLNWTVIVLSKLIREYNVAQLILYKLQNFALSWYRGNLCSHISANINLENCRSWRRQRQPAWTPLEELQPA